MCGGAHPAPTGRPAPVTCSHTRSSPIVGGGGDAAAPACSTVADCTSDGSVNFFYVACLHGACSTDRCITDSDCGTGQICACANELGGGPVRLGNECMATQCQVDSDCGEQVCSASIGKLRQPPRLLLPPHPRGRKCLTDSDCCGSTPLCTFQTDERLPLGVPPGEQHGVPRMIAMRGCRGVLLAAVAAALGCSPQAASGPDAGAAVDSGLDSKLDSLGGPVRESGRQRGLRHERGLQPAPRILQEGHVRPDRERHLRVAARDARDLLLFARRRRRHRLRVRRPDVAVRLHRPGAGHQCGLPGRVPVAGGRQQLLVEHRLWRRALLQQGPLLGVDRNVCAGALVLRVPAGRRRSGHFARLRLRS